MKQIDIWMIPHHAHRIPNTLGDYFEVDKEYWRIQVTQLPKDCRHSCILAVHELVELLCTQAHNIPEARITAWDKKMTRKNPDLEPGDQPGCPYGREHRFAEKIERLLAKEMGVKWSDYTKALNDVWNETPLPPVHRARKR